MVPYPLAGVEESIGELETELGMPEGQLVRTIETYNRGAAKGEDPLFHKDSSYLTPLVNGPFAALDLSVDQASWAAFTLGGLNTKATGEVLTVDDEIVVAGTREQLRHLEASV